ncbi:MAG: transglutaminase-like cysteine peptidase [Kiloniellales bacterium]
MLPVRLLGAAVVSGALVFGLIVILAAQLGAPPPTPPERIFTFSLTDRVTMPGFPQWTAVVGRDWAHDGASDALCSERLGRPCQLRTWQSFLAELDQAARRLQLEEVNRFVNRVSYRRDEETWGEIDYWAAPGEFFASGGDCEDFAIAKYYSLKALGFPTDSLRILVLKDTRREMMHAVLMVEDGGETLLLDNLSDRLLTWAEAPHYRPIYSINEVAYNLHQGRDIAAATVTAAGELLPADATWLRDEQAYWPH